MNFLYRLVFAILASAAIAHSSYADDDDDDDDEDEVNPYGFYRRVPDNVEVSAHFNNGPKVKFGNVGDVPVPGTFLATSTSAGAIGRTYMNGSVGLDTPRANELDANLGNQTSSKGLTYPIYSSDGSGGLVSLNLSYTKGQTREYAVTNSDQVQTTGSQTTVAFNNYSADTQGESVSGRRTVAGGLGLDLKHQFTKMNSRVSLSLVGGLTFNSIYSSRSASNLSSALRTSTDVYKAIDETGVLQATGAGNTNNTPPVPIGSIAATGGFDSTILPIYGATNQNGTSIETTMPLVTTPTTLPDTVQANGATVSGNWKIRGAFYTLRVGPQVSAKITPTLSLSAGAGIAGAYAGTTYSSIEQFYAPEVTAAVVYDDSSVTAKLLAGYYANVDATWEVNERSGLFAGVSVEGYGSYSQTLGNQTAKVDLGNTLGLHGGISIKF